MRLPLPLRLHVPLRKPLLGHSLSRLSESYQTTPVAVDASQRRRLRKRPPQQQPQLSLMYIGTPFCSTDSFTSI